MIALGLSASAKLSVIWIRYRVSLIPDLICHILVFHCNFFTVRSILFCIEPFHIFYSRKSNRTYIHIYIIDVSIFQKGLHHSGFQNAAHPFSNLRAKLLKKVNKCKTVTLFNFRTLLLKMSILQHLFSLALIQSTQFFSVVVRIYKIHVFEECIFL